MVNWQKYIIAGEDSHFSFDNILFSCVNCADDSKGKLIWCANFYPFNTWKKGDFVEIDVDGMRYYNEDYSPNKSNIINDTSMVRKFGSSAVVPNSSTGMTIGSTTITREHGLAIARELDSYVEQSGGRNEYTASIEVQDERGRPIKFSLSSKRNNYQ